MKRIRRQGADQPRAAAGTTTAGVPTGGQFTQRLRSAPTTTLEPLTEMAEPEAAQRPALVGITAVDALAAVSDPDTVARYTLGDCHMLAHAVAERTGWGLTMVGDVTFEAGWCDDDCPDDCVDPAHGSWAVENLVHAYARRPDGALVDIRGVHDPSVAEDLAARWGCPVHTYATAAEADAIWDHAQWATSDDDIDDANEVAGYVVCFGSELHPNREV